jgi:putative hydrolase
MIPVDLHSHSSFSACGLHSFIELLQQAKLNNMSALAITDHGAALKGRLRGSFFERLIDPVPGIRLLKGVELNVLDDPAECDAGWGIRKHCDLLLLGLHPNTVPGKDADYYTDLLIACMKHNKEFDIITHPNSEEYPVDFPRLVSAAVRYDKVIELNNSKVMFKRIENKVTEELICVCRDLGCNVTVNSDAHALNEIGRDEDLRPLLLKNHFPEELIINATTPKAYAWLAARKLKKST